MIAIDTSVLIDLLGGDARADAAEAVLRDALSKGPVVACEVVVAEVCAGLGHSAEIMAVLTDMGLQYSPMDARSALRAGDMQRSYKQRLRGHGGAPSSPRTIPDFLVGAHALLQCKGLITRDQGFFRDYFKGLRLFVPQAA